MNKLLIILGAPNDHLGNLSQIAMDRLTCALNFYHANAGFNIVCTGGFGEHFNTTAQPHHHYARKFLTERNIPADAFLSCPASSNTFEDFQMTRDLVMEMQPDILVIITSDFHMPRARLLYSRIINYPKVIFIPAASEMREELLTPLMEHEARAMKQLQAIDPT